MKDLICISSDFRDKEGGVTLVPGPRLYEPVTFERKSFRHPGLICLVEYPGYSFSAGSFRPLDDVLEEIEISELELVVL
jgi:hypothetical protein